MPSTDTTEAWDTALVTGASSGLGEAFAHALAPRVKRLILAARREDRLVQVRGDLFARHPSLEDVEIHRVDLTRADERADFFARTAPRTDFLVNNAGMGDYGTLESADWGKIAAMMELNMAALTHGMHAVLPGMLQRGRGAIVNVSSLAGETFVPDFAVYAASKAYVTRLSEAVRLEVVRRGVRVVAVCPGPVHTEFGSIARRETERKKDPMFYGFIYTTPEKVASDALRAVGRGRAVVFPSWKVALVAQCIRALPLPLKRLVLARRPRQSTPIS